MRNLNGAAPHITWVNIVATVALLFTAAGGGWILFQTQIAQIRQEAIVSDEHLEKEIKHLTKELDLVVVRLHADIVARREHEEFVKRVDGVIGNLQRRLDVIESTRPTTGELQARASELKTEIEEVKERLKIFDQPRK